jgi:aconitate hydratase
VALVKAYAQAQGLFRQDSDADPIYADILELDLATVEPSLAGPKRPQDRVPLHQSKQLFEESLRKDLAEANIGKEKSLQHGAVVIAAITSCTNTSNPAVMLAAGLVARNAMQRGMKVPAWVKTSLAPGSRVVTSYLDDSGLSQYLNGLGFELVGYGCTTCIGNSGPLPEEVSEEIRKNNLYVCSVLSGNRNFEGRIHPEVRMNYLASPPLVVIYALAGRMDIDLYNDPLGQDKDGKPVYMRDIWPTRGEVDDLMKSHIHAKMFQKSYSDVFAGDAHWKTLVVPKGNLYQWDDNSNYVRKPPYFKGMSREVPGVKEIHAARVLAKLGDSVTTDHISPAGSFKRDTPAGKYLLSRGVQERDFNSYGSRRGDHEVMVRGTFANVRLRNQLAPGTEGGFTTYIPSGEQMTIFDASMKYQQNNVQLIILAGKEYGSGSSRDWAAKGPRLLGVYAVIAESYERIHRSNLVGMGILPLEYKMGNTAESLGLTGKESFDIKGIGNGSAKEVTVIATDEEGNRKTFQAKVRLDTPQEVEYYQNGGILQYVLRSLL